MKQKRLLSEEAIGDLLLCEPITTKGRQDLIRLGLSTAIVTPKYFYENLRVEPKFSLESNDSSKPSPDNGDYLYYQYTIDNVQFDVLKGRLKKFNSRFCSNSPNEYPLLMLGVAGNGKSIEINRRIQEIYPDNRSFDCGNAIFDLENSFTEIIYGSIFQCPDNTSLWCICIKILDGIMQYIKSCKSLCSNILKNFNSIIVSNNLADKNLQELFACIGAYASGNIAEETAVFNKIKSLLDLKQAKISIQILIKIQMYLMFCSDPKRKHYIILDNIEQYIELNKLKIQIPNSDITIIYKIINAVVMNMINAFDRIEQDLGWKAFKIIIVLRRTSIGLLDPTLLHSPARLEHNITDVTGYFQIPDIWNLKKKNVLNRFLQDFYDNNENKKIIDLIDFVMADDSQRRGISYQTIIAPLMSYGIRRNARSQAHSIYETYRILSDNSKTTIDHVEFLSLKNAVDCDNKANRYIFRRALLEFQFKWSISNDNQDRWMKLGIGHLDRSRKIDNPKLTIHDVKYYDTNHITFVRRILTVLSYYCEDLNPINKHKESVVDMFETISLYDLLYGVFVNPKNNKEISDDELLQFARVLIALSDMSNKDTRSAPFIILGIKDSVFHEKPDESVLAKILHKIWKAGKEKSIPGEEFNCSDYGVRITAAGNSFLLDWQASFSFIAALYCFTIPPLFFIKDTSVIKYVIQKVYHSACDLCIKYEAEAARFCGEGITLSHGRYLPMHKNKCISFKERVKELHIKHLKLYRDFIEKNYFILKISEKDMKKLTNKKTGFIDQYIKKYSAWNTENGDKECF